MSEAATELELERTLEPRLYYLDNLRIALVALVVMHHVAMTYGAAGLFYYVEFHPDGFSRGLLVFVLANQAWFMGAFFLLAGYFTPGAFDRKGAPRFLRDRSLRLGTPTIAYALLLNPLAFIGTFYVADYLGPQSWDTYEYWEYVRMGPMWFVVMLLIFSVGYALLRWARRSTPTVESAGKPPSYLGIAVFILALAGASYLMRLAVPIGEEVLGFPSLAYLPQYLSFFVLGTIAYRKDWLATLSLAKGLVGLAAAALACLLLFPLAFSGEMFSMELTENLSEAMGEGTWRSAVYALWDSTLAVGLTMFLIVLFRQLANRQGAFGAYAARHSYTVYVIHIPVVVFTGVALRGVEIEHLLKVGVAGVIALVVCWALAYPIRKIPGASKVL